MVGCEREEPVSSPKPAFQHILYCKRPSAVSMTDSENGGREKQDHKSSQPKRRKVLKKRRKKRSVENPKKEDNTEDGADSGCHSVTTEGATSSSASSSCPESDSFLGDSEESGTDAEFPSQREFKRHHHHHHHSKSSKSRLSLAEKQLDNNETEGLACLTCLKKFSNCQNLRRHLKLHIARDSITPDFENGRLRKDAKGSEDLVRVPAIDDGAPLDDSGVYKNGKYLCDWCPARFDNRSAARLHESGHKDKLDELKCYVCEKKYADRYSLRYHLRTHGIGRQIKCEYCNKSFSKPSRLEAHVKSNHKNIRNFKCDVCDRAFKTEVHLKNHSRGHTGERPFDCQICGQKFRHKASLTTHLRSHEGARPYVCEVCGKAFREPSTLKAHNRVHSGEKPYKCDMCDKRFTQRAGLNYHRRNCHANSRENNKNFVPACGNKQVDLSVANEQERRRKFDEESSTKPEQYSFSDANGGVIYNNDMENKRIRTEDIIHGKQEERRTVAEIEDRDQTAREEDQPEKLAMTYQRVKTPLPSPPSQNGDAILSHDRSQLGPQSSGTCLPSFSLLKSSPPYESEHTSSFNLSMPHAPSSRGRANKEGDLSPPITPPIQNHSRASKFDEAYISNNHTQCYHDQASHNNHYNNSGVSAHQGYDHTHGRHSASYDNQSDVERNHFFHHSHANSEVQHHIADQPQEFEMNYANFYHNSNNGNHSSSSSYSPTVNGMTPYQQNHLHHQNEGSSPPQPQQMSQVDSSHLNQMLHGHYVENNSRSSVISSCSLHQIAESQLSHRFMTSSHVAAYKQQQQQHQQHLCYHQQQMLALHHNHSSSAADLNLHPNGNSEDNLHENNNLLFPNQRNSSSSSFHHSSGFSHHDSHYQQQLGGQQRQLHHQRNSFY